MKTTFITGGQASGKSTKALEIALAYPAPRVMIATAQAYDEEMKEKIRRHQEERRERFITLEEPFDLPKAFEQALTLRPTVVVIDCLTMWVSNLLLAEKTERISALTDRFIAALDQAAPPTESLRVIMVSNEVGFGVIPANALSRAYIVLLGSVNKAIAKACDQVLLMISGLPVIIKGGL